VIEWRENMQDNEEIKQLSIKEAATKLVVIIPIAGQKLI
jgi:hypothetical protein